jgi:hypothetical protein
VRRSANADDFVIAVNGISDSYKTTFKPQLDILDAAYVSNASPAILEVREVHARAYIVNSLLAALNWRMTATESDDLPNLAPEVSVTSQQRGTTRYMDYLGFEAGKERPLLVVETKRPGADLPSLVEANIALPYDEVFSRGLKGERLTGEWNKWLSDDVGDYVRSSYAALKTIPARVVITNGDWLILFLDPRDAFCVDGSQSPERVLVCESREAIVASAGRLFDHLEHSRVLRGVRPLCVTELLFHVTPHFVDAAMHGLVLLYDEEPSISKPDIPLIKVAPIVFLRSTFGAWFYVEAGTEDYRLPTKREELPAHLLLIKTAAEALLAEIGGCLNRVILPRPIEEHYADVSGFETIRGVTQVPSVGNKFLLVTGSATHYLAAASSVVNCPFHDYSEAARDGVADELVQVRRTNPRAFFSSTEEHHCARSDVRRAKQAAISVTNEQRCGSRSRGRGHAFCEIWPFETYLCCRTCVYERVCTGTQVFRLPCSRS